MGDRGRAVGTFATGFVLVPLMATSTAVYATGGVVMAAALLVAVRFGVGSRPIGLGCVAGAVALVALALAAGSPCDAESDYHCVNVHADQGRAGGRTLVLDDLTHSYVDLDDPAHLALPYAQLMGDAIGALPDGPLDGVYLGGGGFTLPRYVAAVRPGSRARVLEVDGELVKLVRRRLGVRTGPALRVRVGDARVTLRGEPTDSADLVIGDAFGGRTVPWHLATVEFAREIRRVLRPGGLYALNLIDRGPLRFLRAEAATLLDVFADVRLVAYADGDEPSGGNLVFLASARALPRGMRSTRPGVRTFARRDVARIAGDADVLRDDDAPADQLISSRVTPRPAGYFNATTNPPMSSEREHGGNRVADGAGDDTAATAARAGRTPCAAAGAQPRVSAMTLTPVPISAMSAAQNTTIPMTNSPKANAMNGLSPGARSPPNFATKTRPPRDHGGRAERARRPVSRRVVQPLVLHRPRPRRGLPARRLAATRAGPGGRRVGRRRPGGADDDDALRSGSVGRTCRSTTRAGRESLPGAALLTRERVVVGPRGSGLLARAEQVEQAVAEQRARGSASSAVMRSVSSWPGTAKPWISEAEDDRAEHAAEERADDARPAAVGQEHREVPEGEAHHRPGEQSHGQRGLPCLERRLAAADAPLDASARRRRPSGRRHR